MQKYVLVICGRNAGRSQIIQAFFNELRGHYPTVDSRYEAISVGTNPGTEINPVVTREMREFKAYLDDPQIYFCKGFGHSYIQSKTEKIERAIVACGESCAFPPELKSLADVEHWDLPDPHEASQEEVRRIIRIARDRTIDYLSRSETKLLENKLSEVH